MRLHRGADGAAARERMVERQIAARGIRDPAVLAAMRAVPREAFLPPELAEFAYQDSPLPIGADQTISQPYIVALMAEALDVGPGDQVLEIGAGSGYAAAVLAEIVGEVYTVERHAELAERARRVLAEQGYHNVHVRHGDGTRGWPEHAPYDAIVVAAGGPQVPPPLLEQLAVGGRLVIPVGETLRLQRLVRLTRISENEVRREELGEVRFVPLIGDEGWEPEPHEARAVAVRRAPARLPPARVAEVVARNAEPFDDLETADLDPLVERIGDARLVLLGEATHGTSEFYRLRARITKVLIERRGFDIVAVEADWPDAARVDAYVRRDSRPPEEGYAFTRFPSWMWRNREVHDFVEWLRAWNGRRPAEERTGFHGLDLYSLNASIDAVLGYLDRVDPDAARIGRQRYGCLSPWESDPAVYGRAAVSGRYRSCEADVVAMLKDLHGRRMEYMHRDGERFLDAVQNARLVASAERYYRVMYSGATESWNLRDQHMFDTLQLLLNFRGKDSRAVVWEHNSHIGDAAATEMSARGQTNVGRLCREEYGEAAILIGFGTDHGTVAAASDWDGPLEIKTVRPAHPESYERICHDSGVASFLLALREPSEPDVREALEPPRLERAIGVIYRPETELQSHYFQAVLTHQFDEYVWFDETRAVTPLATVDLPGMPETWPFGL